MPKRPRNDPDAPFRVSRRTFLKTVGVGAAAAGLVAPGPRPAEAAVLGPDDTLCSVDMCRPGRSYFEPR